MLDYLPLCIGSISSNQLVSINREVLDIFINEGNTITDTVSIATSGAIPNVNFETHKAGTNYNDSELSMVWVGGSIQSEINNFNLAWNTYFTSL